MAITGYISLGVPIGPNSENDPYFVTNPQFGLGGLRTVTGSDARDAIIQARRQQGMVVYVQDIQKFYTLVGSTGNTAWTEIISNGASASSVVTSFNGLTGAIIYSPRLATSSLTGVASFGNEFVVSSLGAVSLTGNYVASVNGRTGNVGLPLATTSITGFASFNLNDFVVSSTGNVSLTDVFVGGATFNAAVSVAGSLTAQSLFVAQGATFNTRAVFLGGLTSSSMFVGGPVTFGSTLSVGGTISGHSLFVSQGATFSSIAANTVSANNLVTAVNGRTGNVSLPLATASITGFASFNSSDFVVSAVGAVSLSDVFTGGVTFTAAASIAGSLTAQSLFVAQGATFNGSATFLGGITASNLFVSSGATFNTVSANTVSANNLVTSVNGRTGGVALPLATSSITGVASFNFSHFSVSSTGNVSLISMPVSYSFSDDFVNELNVISLTGNVVRSFNGQTGAVVYSPPLATSNLTGFASFNLNDFVVSSTGNVSLTDVFSSGATFQSFVSVAGSLTASNLFVSQGATFNTVAANTVSANNLVTAVNGRTGNVSLPLASASITGFASFNSSDFVVSVAGAVSLTDVFTGGATFTAAVSVAGSLTAQSLFVSQGATFSSIAANTVSANNLVTAVNGRTGNVGLPLATTTGITGVAWFNPTDFNVGTTGRVTLTTKAFQATTPGVDDSPSYLYMPSALQSNKVRLTSDESYGATTVSEILATQIVTTSTTTRLLLAGAVSGEIIFNTSGSSAQSMSLPTYYPVADVTVVAMTDFDAVPVSYCTSKFMIVKNESGGTEFTEYANICSGTQLGTYAIQATGPESYWGLVVTPTSANKTFFSVNATRFKRPYSAIV